MSCFIFIPVDANRDEQNLFFKSISDATILFQNPVQTEDDLNASKVSEKAESLLMTEKKNKPKRNAIIDHL